jgi:type IV pilus assembly protein PilQ
MKSYQTLKMISFFLFWLFVNSCATSNTLVQTPPPDIPSKVVKVSTIQKISFIEEENYSRIQMEGSETLEPPFYKLLSDPLRIAIDVPNIDLKQIKEPIKIDGGTVSEVLTTQFDDKGRIEICLTQMTNYNIFKEDKILIIDIEKVKKIAEVKEEVKEEAIKEKEIEIAPQELKKEETSQVQPIETVTAPETLPKAKEILSFLFDQKKDFIAFNIAADGKIGNYNAFKLDSPPRLVLDIWEVGTRYPKNLIKIQNPFIKKVRIGRHPDKLRLVFECPTPQLPSYQINRTEDKLMVSFGNVPQPSEPQIVLQEKAPEGTSSPKKAQAQVKAPIEFKQMDHKSRIVVSLTEEPQFESHTISKNTVAVDIKNAFIPKHLQKGLDTSEFDSAVKYIDLKNVKVGKANDVRILIKLREEVPFETTKEGNTLFIDIEKPKKVEAKIEAVPEAKKEEVTVETKKEEVKEEVKKEEVKKEEEKPLSELKEPEKVLPPVEEKPIPQTQVIKKAEEEKKVGEEVTSEKVYTGRRMSLDFKDADIKNILRLIAEVSNFNIITGDDVTGKVTMRLVDVPWDQALEIILQARSLGMSKVGNVIRIAPLDSLKKEIQAELEAKRTKEKLEDLVTELIPVNYATAKELLSQIKGILSERGDIKVDDRTNILIVKDIPRNILLAKNLVKSLDTKTPQVLIEARIVEATLSFQRDLGISWGFLTQTGTDNKKTFSTGGGTGGTSTLREPAGTAEVSTRPLVDLPAGNTAGILEFLFTSEYGLKNLDVAISAYENKGEAKVIASPKIATIDNKEASVEQGLRIPYTKLTTEGTPTEDFLEANLKLTVTPHVTSDGHVKMSIKVKKDEPDYGRTSTYGTPSINKKEAITEVLVKDNGVVVIAGIYTIKKGDTTTGVPLFSKIPVLGWLFKKESKTNDTTDLLIFISPKIFKGDVL